MVSTETMIIGLVVAVFLNMVVGLMVMASVDDEQHRLMHWVHRSHSPYPSFLFAYLHMLVLWPLVMNLWPLVVVWWLRSKARG